MTSEENSYHLVVSHNNRIQSWLDKIIPKVNRLTYKKIRFSNCAALSVVFSSNEITIKLLYSGDSASNKKGQPYWVSESFIEPPELNYQPVKFKQIVMTIDSFLQLIGITDKDIIKNLFEKNFLIVRHGEAEHNIVSLNTKSDTNLTQQGILQGFNLGRFLKDKINLNKECYVSDLFRTEQTACIIGRGFIFQSENIMPSDNYFEKYIVVPCNHELSKEDGFEKSPIPFIQNENKSTCTIGSTTPCIRMFTVPTDLKSIYDPNNTSRATMDIILTDKLDWTIYNEYYKSSSSSRTIECSGIGNFFINLNKCVNNFPSLQIVNSSNGGYKKRKTQRKSRKRTKKTNKKNKKRTLK